MRIRRVRSLLFVLTFIVLFTFPLLFLNSSTSVFYHPAKNSTAVKVRQRSCSGCFRVDFPLFVNHPEVCSVRHGQVVDIIIFIFSHPDGADTRAAIRSTWASVSSNNTSNFRHVFITGMTSNATRMRLMAEESRRHGDVVISQFHDSYNNLTLKTVTSLRWVTRYCSHARFFFKVDDDVWVNSQRLLDTFSQSRELQTGGSGGYCKMSSRVLRQSSSKWYASYEAYPDDKYPSYCSGVGYGGTLELARRLVDVSENVPFFHLEDVYVGLCLRSLNLNTVHLQGVNADCWDLCDALSDRVITCHKVTPRQMRRLWTLRASCGSDASVRYLMLDVLFLAQ